MDTKKRETLIAAGICIASLILIAAIFAIVAASAYWIGWAVNR